MDQDTTNNVEAVRDLVVSHAGCMTAEEDAKPYAVVPKGYQYVDLEPSLQVPVRSRGTVALSDAASFIAMVQRLDPEDGHACLYGRVDPPAFKAVLNDHIGGEAGWRDHVLTYDCPLSREWKTWLGANGKPMAQEQFAKFVEDNALQIHQPIDRPELPSATEMLEIALTFEAKKKVNFASGIRLDNGQQQLTYEETIDGTSRKGQLKVPQTFAIALPVLEGGAPYMVECRFRYRIADGGGLAVWFDMIRPHKALEDAVLEVWKQIAEGTGLRVFNGGI